MRRFEDILMMAVERKGSFDAVLGGVDPPKSADDLAATPNSAWLAAFNAWHAETGYNFTQLSRVLAYSID